MIGIVRRRARHHLTTTRPVHPTPAGAASPPETTVRAEEIDCHVAELLALLPGRLNAATAAFLTGDRRAAEQLVASDPAIDSLQVLVEDLIENELLRRPESDDQLRYLVTVLRIVPELERSADLVEHIALRAQRALVSPLPPQARAMIEAMGVTGSEMWRTVGVAYVERDDMAAALARMDDDLDDLHVQLTNELAGLELESSVAIELGLVARFFERLGDHAVNVARRMTYCLPVAG